MSRACCVLGCPSKKGTPSHRLHPAQFTAWKNIIYSQKIEHLTDEQLLKCVVCYRHFTDDDYISHHSIRNLKPDAVPSKNLPGKDLIDTVEKEKQLSCKSAWLKAPCSNIIHNTNQCDNIDDKSNITKSLLVGANQGLKRNIEDVTHSETSACHGPENVPNTSVDMDIKVTPVKKHPKFHILPEDLNEADLTPKKKKLYNTAKYLTRRYSTTLKKSRLLQERIRQANKFSKSKPFQRLLSALSPSQRAFINMQIANAQYSPRVWIKLYHDLAMKKALGKL